MVKNKNIIVWIVGILFIMSIMPGEGEKIDETQQSMVDTIYTCDTSSDCPKCVGGGIEEFNASDPSFLGELGHATCEREVCQLSDACLIWDCGNTQAECSSVKQTLFDNTIGKFNESPGLFVAILALFAIYLML